MNTLQIERPRILILDCNRFELATLADSLRMHGVNVVGEAPDATIALELFGALHPDSVLINIQGCDASCIDLLHRLREEKAELGIVLLTDTPDLRLYGIHESELPTGTQIIEKSALHNLEEIRSAIDLANQANAKTTWIANKWDSTLNSLTDIQIETLRLLALGLSNSDIGKKRYVSEKSVEQTITRIGQHLNVAHEKGRNMRVMLASEYYRWLGSPKEHAI
jgi:DNA-binding NarL/FixJ family response regulator